MKTINPCTETQTQYIDFLSKQASLMRSKNLPEYERSIFVLITEKALKYEQEEINKLEIK